jgi:hypothetical protein
LGKSPILNLLSNNELSFYIFLLLLRYPKLNSWRHGFCCMILLHFLRLLLYVCSVNRCIRSCARSTPLSGSVQRMLTWQSKFRCSHGEPSNQTGYIYSPSRTCRSRESETCSHLRVCVVLWPNLRGLHVEFDDFVALC